MGTRFRFLVGVVVPVLLLSLSACTTSSSSTPSGSGALFVATQGDSSVSAYTIDLSAGTLTANGKGVATGSTPSAMVLAPSGSALFVANSGTNDISAYSVKSDGTLTAGSTTPTGGMTPLSISMDSAGHFLFVANQGLQIDPASGTISVFAVQDAALTAVPGSPFRVAELGASSGTGPAGVAVTPDGKFLYVSNQFDGTVTSFSVNASGVLTRGLVVPVGTAPSGLAITPNGGFLYVANSSTVSGFAICNQIVTSCNDPTAPDGVLTALTGSPFSSGLGPVSIVAAPSGKFLFVVDRLSNQVSQYKIATGTGVLTANTQATISTGANPVWAALRVGTTTDATTGGTTNFLYVAELGASSISIYTFDSTVGTLGRVGPPISVTGGQPSAVAAE
ncbi:MAG: lactonase family protein [Acidobacteriia bacterium]|nr:lactonase family protein [Terriglobia bacterium]